MMLNALVLLVDAVLIALLVVAVLHARRLHQQLTDLKASRADMDRFVEAFSVTVQRAEAGVRGLKQTARESGDDLEKLLDKATRLRDELVFLTDSADSLATRLSDAATRALRAQAGSATRALENEAAALNHEDSSSTASDEGDLSPSLASAAERDLARVLRRAL